MSTIPAPFILCYNGEQISHTDLLMKRLWTPWRMKYITQTRKEPGCVFCNVQKQEDSAENLIVFRGAHAFVILNRYPYTNGHLLIVPYKHVSTLEALTPETRAEMMELAVQGMRVLREEYHPQAFNMGANIGAMAGAGIAEHVHLHVVPRWSGDANFMTTLAETRLLPEDLETSYRRIRERWGRLGG